MVVTARRPTPLSGVTVTAVACKSPPLETQGPLEPPRVIQTYPAQGGVVSAGPLEIRVQFDQRMFPCSFAFDPDFPLRFPDMAARPPVLQADQKTFLVQTQVEADRAYAVRLNTPAHPFFVSRWGRTAEPLELKFSTAAALTAPTL